MPVLLPNALISTARASYDAGTHITSAETAHLSRVLAHIDEDKESTLIAQSQGQLDTYYWAMVESGTDIATGDLITALTLLDGVTPWPADWGTAATETWRVGLAQEVPAMLLPARRLRIVRARASGPSH